MSDIKIVAATDNQGKIKELKAIMSKFGIELISKKDAGAGDINPEETGSTFEENSLIKAKAVMEATGMPAVADDSGLEVDALNGEPGVRSARFAGENATYRDNNDKLLELMKDVPKAERTAKFVCVITLCFPDGRTLTARGECRGKIGIEPHGANGFGYDPIFVPNGFFRPFAELTDGDKNRVSHRGNALRELKRQLDEL